MAEPTDEQTRQITDAILKGRKIEAVKIYREATGVGLKESKEFIENLTATLHEKYPDKVPAAKGGCASVLMAGGLLGVGAVVVEYLARG